MKRRDGHGSITKRTDGTYLVRITTDDKRVARVVRRERTESGRLESDASHRRRAGERLDELIAEYERPATLREQWTIRAYATARYLPSLEGRKPATIDSYRRHLELWVYPHLGDVELSEVTGDMIDVHDRALRDAGLSTASRRHARGALKRVLDHATKKGRIEANPCARAETIKGERRDRTADILEPDQVRALLRHARGTRWETPIALMALLGLRRAEALGLAWDDIGDETITIRRNVVALSGGRTSIGTPKTDTSERTLQLPAPIAPMLRSRRREQIEWRLAAGHLWHTATDDQGDTVDLVLTDELGRPTPPHQLTDAVIRMGEQIGVKVHPHLLRHSVASLQIAEGIDVAAIAWMLGHSSPATFTSVYWHALKANKVRASAAMTEAIGEW